MNDIDLTLIKNYVDKKVAASGGGGSSTGDLSEYAPLANPALTGVPTAPTAAANTNTTQIATTAFVQAAIAALISDLNGNGVSY